MLDKIKAVMHGYAVGDALGVSVEFWARDEVQKYPVEDMRGFGTNDFVLYCNRIYKFRRKIK